MSKTLQGDGSTKHPSGTRTESLDSQQQGVQPTERPWIVQQLSHVDNELWLQIGWIEGGRAIGPICELVGGAVKPTPSFRAVAEFKYLVASDDEVRANAEIIVRCVNNFQPLVDALSNLLLWEQSTLTDTPPFGHDCRWCVKCVSRVQAEARAALALARGDVAAQEMGTTTSE